jgi:hypothetical protein
MDHQNLGAPQITAPRLGNAQMIDPNCGARKS